MEPVEIVEEKGGANAFRDAKDKVEEASEDSRGAAGRDEKGMGDGEIFVVEIVVKVVEVVNIGG